MKSKILILFMLLFIICSKPIYADNGITANVTYSGLDVTVSGKVEDVSDSHVVMLFILKDKNIVYTAQDWSDENGVFNFKTTLPDNSPLGLYECVISTSADLPTLYGDFILDFSMSAELFVNDKNVTVIGDHGGYPGSHVVMLSVLDKHKTVICKQAFSNTDGSFRIEAVMPYGIQSGDFDYVISSSSPLNSLYSNFYYVKPVSDVVYISTESVNVSADFSLPYFIQAQSVEYISDKTIIVEYPSDVLKLTDACLFTSAKETSPVNLENLGINIKSVEDGRIEYEVTSDFLEKYPAKAAVSAVLFDGLTDGTAEITCMVINRQEGI